MVADLLEAHQVRQHHALAADAIGLSQRLLQVFHRALVQHGLHRAQATPGLDFGFVGQVGNDAFVGFDAAQDVRLHQCAQRAVMLLAGEAFGEVAKHLAGAQQAGVREVEDRPQV